MAIAENNLRNSRLPRIISTRLEEVGRRQASLQLTAGLLDTWALFLGALFVALVVDWSLTLFNPAVRMTLTLLALAVAAIGLVVLVLVPRLKPRGLAELAADVDRSVPELEERWQTVTKITATSDPESVTGSPRMIERVVAESIERERFIHPERIVPRRTLRKHQWLLAGAIAANAVLFLIDAPQAWILLRRFLAPTAPISLTQVTALSGDLAVARGEPVPLEATLARRPRESAELFLRDAGGKITEIALLPADAERTRFTYTLDAAAEPLSYRFRAGDGETAWHNVSVYDRPQLTGVELRLRPPEYTRMPAVTRTDLPTSLRAVEGTRLELGFSVDQPLDHFDLEFDGEPSTRLNASSSDPLRYSFATTLQKTLRLTPVFVSQHGLANLRPPSCQIVVYPDQRPEVTIVSPDKEISLRPNEQVTVEINARDDFGVVRAELVAFVGNEPELQKAVVLPPFGSDTTNSTTADMKTANSKTPDPQTQGTTKGTAAALQNEQKFESDRAPKTSAAASKGQATPGGSRPGERQPSDQWASRSPDQARPDNTESAKNAPSPRRTVIMPIPLGSQAGEKNVRAKVKLDLGQFHLKHGEQLQYLVRVYDSHSAGSQGQSHSDQANATKSSSSMADASQRPRTSQGESASGRTGAETRQPASAGEARSGMQASGDRASEKTAARNNTAERRNAGRQQSTAAASKSSPRTPAKSAAGAGKIAAANSNEPNRQAAADQGNPGNGSPMSQPSSDQKAGSSASSPKGEPTNGGREQREKDRTLASNAPRPEDGMSRRLLDAGAQASASSTMKITIDKWAGSFEGQARRKLELAIDPVLKDLDAALVQAIEELRPVPEALSQPKPPADEIKKSLRAAETHVARGQSMVAELVQKSAGTPYAFIGLQLVDITELHISPARLDIKTARGESPARGWAPASTPAPAPAPAAAAALASASDRKQRVEQATAHLIRAREMLADLTRKYESAKRDLQLAEDMQRIKTMYQFFIEDSMAFLAANRSTLNPKNRKMTQFELDEEFLKQYTELQKEWERTLAELAKALAKDPRLLARYMNLSRRRTDTLRDQLTLLNLRQQELLALVEQSNSVLEHAAPAASPANGAKSDKPALPAPPGGSEGIRASLARDLGDIATATIAVQEDLSTWLPLGIKPDDPRIGPLKEQAARLATSAVLAAKAARNAQPGKPAATAKEVDDLAAQLKSFEKTLAGLAESDDATLVEHVNRRLARVRKLQQSTASWIEKNAHVRGERYHRALAVDQHRLSEDTLELQGKLENLGAQLAGLPDEVLALADELKDTIRYEVLVDQMSAELRLNDREVPAAKTHQKKAIEGFARAEERFNKLIDRIIQEQDKVPQQVPDLDNMQLPTLEELLGRLERETDLAELLGIPNRPTNLQGLRDWLMQNSQGQGAGMAAGGRIQQRLLERARQDALRAVAKKGGAKRDPSKQVQASARWNTLGSRLEDVMRQGRGNTPPRQYRRAIERYFEVISGATNAEAGLPAPTKKNVSDADGSTKNSP